MTVGRCKATGKEGNEKRPKLEKIWEMFDFLYFTHAVNWPNGSCQGFKFRMWVPIRITLLS